MPPIEIENISKKITIKIMPIRKLRLFLKTFFNSIINETKKDTINPVLDVLITIANKRSIILNKVNINFFSQKILFTLIITPNPNNIEATLNPLKNKSYTVL